MLAAALAGALVAVPPTSAGANEIVGGCAAVTAVEPTVLSQLSSEGAADFWVLFAEQADLAEAYEVDDWAQRGELVYQRLTETARASQAELTAELTARGIDHEPYWIVNAVLVRDADRATLDAVRAVDSVAQIRADWSVAVVEPVETAPEVTMAARTGGVEWGVADVGADRAWDELGVAGDGIVVASIDTGVEFTHPELVERYRGYLGDGEFSHDYHWWDPTGVCLDDVPCDDNNHGTHVTGTMIGTGQVGDRIGVAPQATWIAAKGCQGVSCPSHALLSSGQFMLAPTELSGLHPRPDLRPNVVNNSWSGDPGSPWYDGIVSAWSAAGIFGVFSSGNSGPGCATGGAPGDGAPSWTVGAHDSTGVIADFSSRGPGRTGIIKPDISAPGVDVRSSVRGGGYARFNGTSMAAPHQAGAVALLWSAAPWLIGEVDATRQILADTARPVDDTSCGGTPEHNNVYGYGTLDAYAAVAHALGGVETGAVAGTVTDGSGEPVTGVTVSLVVDRYTRSAPVGVDGSYQLPHVPPGEYEVTAAGFGYGTVTEQVTVVTDQTTGQDFTVSLQPLGSVTGTVTDATGAVPLLGATVELLQTPLPPATLDSDGRYTIAEVPEGDYTMRVIGDGCHGHWYALITVTGDTTADVTLVQRGDDYGHRCHLVEAEFIETTEVLPEPTQNNRNWCRPVVLPFPFPFYGNTYGLGEGEPICAYASGAVRLGTPLSSAVGNPLTWPAENIAAIYPFWGYLDHVEEGWYPEGFQMRTATVGEPGDQRLVIEWNQYEVWNDDQDARFDFQVVLHERGEITFQYRGIDPDNPFTQGISAEFGIQNVDKDVLSYSAAVADEYAIRFVPSDGHIRGVVSNGTDTEPVVGATVTATHGELTRTTRTREDGRYALAMPPGDVQVEIAHPRHRSESRTVPVALREVTPVDAVLAGAAVSVDPGELEVTLAPGERATVEIEVSNPGDAALEWATLNGLGTAEAVAPVSSAPPTPGFASTPDFTTGGTDVRDSWPVAIDGVQWAPMGMEYAEDTLWVSVYDVGNPEGGAINREYAPDGTPTGREWPAPTPQSPEPGMRMHPLSLTYDPTRGWMCQVFMPEDPVSGGNVLTCWDPDTGEVRESLTLAPWEVDDSGATVGYQPDGDTFYVLRFNDRRPELTQLAGFSHPEPGQRLRECTIWGQDRRVVQHIAASSLAVHRGENLLRIISYAFEPTVFDVDPDTCQVRELRMLDVPEREGGLIMPPLFHGITVGDGDDLWVADMDTYPFDPSGQPNPYGGFVYRVDGGIDEFSDSSWLVEVTPDRGRIAAGATGTVQVTLDAAGLEVGSEHVGEVVLATNAARHDQTRVRIPVRITVAEQQVSCTERITGHHTGPLTVTDGVTCVEPGARVSGPVRVHPGASLVVDRATLNGPVDTDGAELVELVDSLITGPLTIRASVGEITVTGNQVYGPVSVEAHRTGTPALISGNIVAGPLRCTGNEPPPTNGGVPNWVLGPAAGQCAGI